jgi:hypothetical protein
LKRNWLAGFISGSLLLGCAGAAFNYRYFGLQGVTYTQGVLLGPKESQDIPFSACEPGLASRSTCVVMLAKDFFALKQDYEDTQQRLKECGRDK